MIFFIDLLTRVIPLTRLPFINTECMEKTILIVDDDIDDRELFGEALAEIDNTIHCIYAKHGYEALDILYQPDAVIPDYIFLDLNMPRLNGKECLALIKKTERFKVVPVIIFSTSKLDSDVEETRKLGATLFLTKPAKFSQLVDILTSIIAKKWSFIKI